MTSWAVVSVERAAIHEHWRHFGLTPDVAADLHHGPVS